MDISLLREQYRSTRETQKRHTQVLLFRTVSDELSEAINIVPVSQGLMSPWEPNIHSPWAITSESHLMTYDPWHVHLDVHRRCWLTASASSSETTNTNISSRRSSSSPEAVDSQQDLDSTSDSPISSRARSPFKRTKEEDHFNAEKSRGEPETVYPVQVSVSALGKGSREDHPDASFTDSQECSAASLSSSDESSTPVASITCSPGGSTTTLQEDLKEGQSAGRKTSHGVLQYSNTSAWRGSRKFTPQTLRFTRQLSVGGVGSSAGVHQDQSYQPFPHRKTPRISEAARRLGMYSSF
nr:uncharacterized protein LOC124049854 isoform X2 [Scatophagus argus]